MKKVVILSRQVTHYHHARFEAAAEAFGRLEIISLANQGKFTEILSGHESKSYIVHRIFEDLDSYRHAAETGKLASEISARLELIDPDVVAISGWASAESFSAMVWARVKGRSLVLMSDSQAHDANRNPLREWIKGRVVRQCGAGLVAGRSHRDYLVQLGMGVDQIRLGYDAVDNEHFFSGALAARTSEQEFRARLTLPENYIVASARFISKKNLAGLLNAYAQARQGLMLAPDLLIAGDGEQRPVIEAAARSLGLSGHVHLPGFFGYEDMPAVYGLSRGFVHVPLSEQWGLVVNEAAACGQPMVLSKECGAAGELLQEGRNGWRVEAKNGSELAAALRAMMSISKGQHTEMGAVSRSIVSEWGPECFARELACATRIAEASRKGSFSLFDRLIVGYLSRRVIETVA